MSPYLPRVAIFLEVAEKVCATGEEKGGNGKIRGVCEEGEDAVPASRAVLHLWCYFVIIEYKI